MLDRLLELFQSLGGAVLPFFVVDAYQRALVLRFGVFHRECAPGFHWRWPGAERVLEHGVVTSVHALQPQSLSTKDGHSVVIQALLTWRVTDVKKLLLDVEDAQHALRDSAHGIISTHVSNATWAEVTTPGFLDDAQKDIRKRAFRWGIEVTQVQFSDMARCESLRLLQEQRYAV